MMKLGENQIVLTSMKLQAIQLIMINASGLQYGYNLVCLLGNFPCVDHINLLIKFLTMLFLR